PLRKPDPDGGHIAGELLFGFLEREVEAAFPPAAGGFREMRADARLSTPRRTGHEDARASVVAEAAQHGVQGFDAGRDPLLGYGMLEVERGDGDDRDPFLVDQERVFVR